MHILADAHSHSPESKTQSNESTAIGIPYGVMHSNASIHNQKNQNTS